MTYMDYERGLTTLRAMLTAPAQRDFAVLEQRLRDNLRRERLYGSTETTRADRAAVIDELNQLALAHIGLTFNDLCLGVAAPPPAPSPLTRDERLAGKQAELAQHERNLSALSNQRAAYGLNPPLQMINAIAFEESEIRRLQQEIDDLHGEGAIDVPGHNG